MKLKLFLFLFSGIVFASCNKKNTISNNELKQIIIEKYEHVRTTLKNGNPSYVLEMHSKDAILFLQNGTEIVGITQLKPFYEKVASRGVDINSTPTNVELLSESVAFEVGVFHSISKAGIQNTAKYINIWKKSDGDWKLYKAIDQAQL